MVQINVVFFFFLVNYRGISRYHRSSLVVVKLLFQMRVWLIKGVLLLWAEQTCKRVFWGQVCVGFLAFLHPDHPSCVQVFLQNRKVTTNGEASTEEGLKSAKWLSGEKATACLSGEGEERSRRSSRLTSAAESRCRAGLTVAGSPPHAAACSLHCVMWKVKWELVH